MAVPSRRSRRDVIVLGIQAGLVALALRLVWIQAVGHARYSRMADDMEQVVLPIDPQRGAVLDRNANSLAVTMVARSLCANPRAVPDQDRAAFAAKLAPVLHMDAAKISDLLSKDKYFVFIKRRLADDEAEAVEKLRLPDTAFAFRDEHRRCYPNGSLLGQVLGFVGVDGDGLDGLEAAYENTLGGTPGEEMVLRDGLGRLITSSGTVRKEAVDGESLMLTIDLRAQRILEEELAAACEKHKPEWGCAVVLNPWNGDVLAMASWPPFDPAKFQNVPQVRRKNLPITECMEPGSTFKPFIASPALALKRVTPDTRFDCHQGVYRIGSRTLHDAHGYGILSVRDIVAYSSNIGMAQVGALLGAEPMYNALRAFGFGVPTGIELPGESAGILHPLRQWGALSISSIPMGQEIAVTPLQLAAGFSVFANGGYYVRPRILLGYADAEGRNLLRPGTPVSYRAALAPATAQLMCRDILAAVVEHGTAKEVAIPGYPLSGKTGTAQIAQIGARGYEDGAYTAAFACIAPNDTPQFVTVVMIRKPTGGSHYGGVVAAPPAARFSERYLSLLRVPRRPEPARPKTIAMKSEPAHDRD